MSAVDSLEENPKEVFETAVRLLIKVADNILNNPEDIKFRRLKLANKNVSDKLLPAIGAIECLFEMGFDEGDDSFVLAMSTPLSNVRSVRDKLVILQNKVNTPKSSSTAQTVPSKPTASTSKSSGSKSKIIIPEEIEEPLPTFPKITSSLSPPFLQQVESYAHQVQQYESLRLQARARSLVPVDELWLRAQTALHNAQSEKFGVEETEDKGLPDLMLYELLQWFKYEFFSWVDKPDCDQCGAKTQSVGMSSDPRHLKESNRTELYECPSGHKTPFHRYNNAGKLLSTRRGRCGEWANCFTLICRAVGMDARLVVDWTDHVWTEVWSATQNRWLHCDACEAVLDAPLTYQVGWGKRLSYVIAFARDDVQDVTWRYTQEPLTEVLPRRNSCTEKQLLNLLNVLRHRLQAKVSPTRKKFLQGRLVNELMSMINVPGQQRVLKSTETQGRTSGSDEWRRERKEIGNIKTDWTWKPKAEEIAAGHMTVKFSAAQNVYVREVTGEEVKGWACGLKSATNVTLKKERDWKMVYLARTESSDKASLEWRFEMPDSVKVSSVKLQLPTTVYETGKVQWIICGESPDLCLPVPNGQSSFSSEDFRGCSAILIKANLSGGSGSCAWQHTQISRQELCDKSFPLQFRVDFK